MFGGALGILHVKCDRFHLEKSKRKNENVLALSADSNTVFKTSKWSCDNWRHSPRPTRVAFLGCFVRYNS